MQATGGTTVKPSTGVISPAAPPLVRDLYALVVHLQKSCNSDVFEALGALDLSLTQVKLLHHLEGQPRELTLGEAGDLVHVSLPAASRLVEDLVRRGLVARNEDAQDRRMKRVRLTDDGLSVIRRLNAARLTGLSRFVDGLTDEQSQTLAGALGKLLARPELAACRPDASAADLG